MSLKPQLMKERRLNCTCISAAQRYALCLEQLLQDGIGYRGLVFLADNTIDPKPFLRCVICDNVARAPQCSFRLESDRVASIGW